MNIKIINNLNQLKEYKDLWIAILNKNKNNNPFIEYDFVDLWWEYFGQDYNLFILCGTSDDGIIGFCPFMIKRGFIKNEINFIGYDISSYMDVVVCEEYKEGFITIIMDYIFEYKKNHIVNLHGLDNSSTLKYIQNYLEYKNKSHITNNKRSYFITNYNNFSDYNKKFKGKSRTTINNKVNKLKRIGELTYKEIDKEKIYKIFELHDKRWKKKDDTSSFSSGNTRLFFKELVLNNNLSFKTCVDTLNLDEKIISYEYGFISRNRYIAYRICHDDDYLKYSPGRIITRYKIQKTLDSDLDIYDFGVGYEAYKEFWTKKYNIITDISFYTSKVSLVYLFHLLKIKTRKTLKKNYKIVKFKRNKIGKIKYYLLFKFIKTKNGDKK